MHKNGLGLDELQDGMRNLQIHRSGQQNASSREKSKPGPVKPVLDSYYAINAPAPGTVGVASARVNKCYSENYEKGFPQVTASSVYSPYYANTQMQVANPSLHSKYCAEDSKARSNSPQVIGERAVYANVASHSQYHPSQYASYGYDDEFPPVPPEEIISHCPPSPVSSSYSELLHTHNSKRATHLVQPPQANSMKAASSATAAYAPLSQTSSTYESIYEPLTPRPSSRMSDVSGYQRTYASPLAKGLAPAPSNQPIVNPDKVGKEAEVDALTNLLVQSMDSSGDPDFFGICARCGEKVVGEGSGCTAMDQVFHIQCFCCVVCLLKLQGKPFYALDSKPYCEDCYLNTLEKCCVCTKPILERILRATGKPYHPQCFTCVVCHNSLDGIPFTVDASNQIHCIDDFHKKFAPRCSVCGEPIMPEAGQDETVRVVALDRSFHVKCYKCEDCGLLLSSEAEGKGCYPLDNHVLCKSCNARRVQALTSKVTTEL